MPQSIYRLHTDGRTDGKGSKTVYSPVHSVHLEDITKQLNRTKNSGKVVVANSKGKRYKLFWMGGEERSDSVGIVVAEK